MSQRYLVYCKKYQNFKRKHSTHLILLSVYFVFETGSLLSQDICRIIGISSHSWIILCMFLCIYVCMFLCSEWGSGVLWLAGRGQRTAFRVWSSSALFWDRVSSMLPIPGWLALTVRESLPPISCRPSGITDTHHHMWLFCGFPRLNSGHQASQLGTL